MKGINDLAKEIHENAIAHGWWEEDPSFPEIIALCHSELSEALEEYRRGRPNLYFPCNAGGLCVEDRQEEHVYCASRVCTKGDPDFCTARSNKPEGIAVEMADCIIRILDWCGKEGIDIDRIIKIKHEYNKTRHYRHGGKKI